MKAVLAWISIIQGLCIWLLLNFLYEKLEIVNRKQSDKIENINHIKIIDTIYELINERFFRERNPKMTKKTRNWYFWALGLFDSSSFMIMAL